VRRWIPLAAAGLGLVSACAHPPEEGLEAVSTRALELPVTVIAREVEGRACRDLHDEGRTREAEAVAAALRNAPGANALMNAEFKVVQIADNLLQCLLIVRGTAVRIEPASEARSEP
jgi:uncharacterized protein YbjQ (UPF0145 family)